MGHWVQEIIHGRRITPEEIMEISVRTRSLNYDLAKSNRRSGTEHFCGTTRRIETNDLRCTSNENARLHYIHPFRHHGGR
jgi:hypothetical protein